jgi:non-heme chloroperoxidase
MKFIETRDGTKIHYVDYGDGAPVILIHGWPLSSAMWEHQLTELPKHGIRCIAYDRRGFGHSGATWNGYDYDTLASDLNDLLEQLDIRNATLAGFSMGGGEAVRYLSEFGTGGRVTKVALIAAVPPFMLNTNDNPNGVDASVFEEMVSGLTKDRADFLGGFSKKFYGVGILTSPVSDAQLEWDRTVALAASPRATLECVRSFSQTDFRKDLDAMRVPTLVIHGDADQTVPFEVSGKETARRIPGAKLLVYKDAPHGLHITHKEDLNRDLREFVTIGS